MGDSVAFVFYQGLQDFFAAYVDDSFFAAFAIYFDVSVVEVDCLFLQGAEFGDSDASSEE